MKRYTKILLGSLVVALIPLTTIVMWSNIRPLIFGDRVHDIAGVFLNMSPRLRSEVSRYRRECLNNPKCNTRLFFLRRDQIVESEWPRVYDRVSRLENWGTGRLTAPYRDEFFRETRGFTPQRLRDEWVPVLQYRDGALVLYPCSETDRRRYVPKTVMQAGLCK
jgi:hypothetical protein